LLNLLTNAVKYTPVSGKVMISTCPAGTSSRRIIVSDTGAGILPEDLPRLFTPFDRLGAERTDVEGAGLGLALCQRLMQAMRGTIGAGEHSGPRQ
jgi:signal transduction histidine kinase